MGPFAPFEQWLFNPCADRKSGWLQEFSAYKTKNHSLNESTKENIPINLYQLYTYWPTVYVEIFHCLCYLTIPHAALTSWGLKLANPHPGDGWSSCSQNFPSWHPGYPGRLCPKFAPRDPAPSSTAVGPLINFWISLEPMINGTKRLEMNGNGDDHQDICHLVSWTKRCQNLNTYDNYFGIQASKMEFMSCGIWELLGKILWGKFIHRFSQNLSCIEYKHHFSQNILGLRDRPCF